jgi:hypothetical protein
MSQNTPDEPAQPSSTDIMLAQLTAALVNNGSGMMMAGMPLGLVLTAFFSAGCTMAVNAGVDEAYFKRLLTGAETTFQKGHEQRQRLIAAMQLGDVQGHA